MHDYLPSTARNLANLIGIDDTLAIMRVHGGHPLDIPRTASPNSMLAQVISAAALEILCAQWGGTRIPHVPVYAKVDKHQRNQMIWEAHQAGEPISALAHRFKLCTRRVNKIISTQRTQHDNKEQLNLFQEPLNSTSSNAQPTVSTLLRDAWAARSGN